MSKSVFTCPKCSKVVQDLAAHDRRMHNARAIEQDTPVDQPERIEHPSEVLTVKRPTKQRAAVSYHCVDCGSEFTGQPETCPGCNTKFNWEGVGNATN